MAYSYSTPLTYGPNNPVAYEGMEYKAQKPSSIPTAIVGTLVGAGAGAYLGNKTNPYLSKDGSVPDSFAKKAYETFVDKNDDSAKKIYNQSKEILKKIDGIKSPEDLKALFNNNAEAVDKMCEELKHTKDEFINGVTQDNLSANKKTIKERLNAINDNQIQSMKNWIQASWDKTENKFKKVDTVKQEVFDSIQDATKGMKTKAIIKYTAIAGLIGGTVSYVAHKLFANKA